MSALTKAFNTLGQDRFLGGTGYEGAVLADGPRMYCRLGGTTFASATTDISGNGNHGASSSGTPTYGQSPLVPGTDFSVSFNGSSGLSWPAAVADVSSITLEAWIKPTTTGKQSFIDRDTSSTRLFRFWTDSNGRLEFIWWTNGGGPFFCTGTLAVPINVIHHVVATYDSTTGVACTYIDGSLSTTTTVSASPLKNGSIPLWLGLSYEGSSSPFSYFTGSIDEFAVYNTALSAQRVRAHYDAGVSGIDNIASFNQIYGSTFTGMDYEFNAVSSSLPAGWSWDNQGTSTYSENGSGILTPQQSQTALRVAHRSLSGGPATWTAIARILHMETGSNSRNFTGIGLRESTTGKIYAFGQYNQGATYQANYWTSSTTWTSTTATSGTFTLGVPVYLRLTKNSSTSYDSQYSTDGTTWTNFDMARNLTSFATTYDQIAFISQAYATTSPVTVSRIDWIRVR